MGHSECSKKTDTDQKRILTGQSSYSGTWFSGDEKRDGVAGPGNGTAKEKGG